MKLSTMLDRNLVFLDKHFDSYDQVIDFLADKISKVKGIPSPAIKEAFLKRENLGTTFYCDPKDQPAFRDFRLDGRAWKSVSVSL